MPLPCPGKRGPTQTENRGLFSLSVFLSFLRFYCPVQLLSMINLSLLLSVGTDKPSRACLVYSIVCLFFLIVCSINFFFFLRPSRKFHSTKPCLHKLASSSRIFAIEPCLHKCFLLLGIQPFTFSSLFSFCVVASVT